MNDWSRIGVLVITLVALGNMGVAAISATMIAQRDRSDYRQILEDRIQGQTVRLESLEKQHAEFRVLITDRLARLEATTEYNNKLLLGIFVSVVLMLLGTLVGILVRVRGKLSSSG